MRRMAVMVLVALIAGCSGGSDGDNEAACAALEDYVNAIWPEGEDSATSTVGAIAAMSIVIETAPSDVSEAFKTLDEGDARSSSYRDAQETASSWARDECDLDVSF